MNPLQEHLFEAVFNLFSSSCIIVKADDPRFTIVSSNEQHKKTTNTFGKAIAGKGLWEVFNPQAGGGLDEKDALIKGMQQCMAEKEPVKLPVLRFDIPGTDGRSYTQTWWQVEITPISNVDGNVEYLMHTSYDVTEQVSGREAKEKARLQQQALQEITFLNEELATANEELLTINEEVVATNEELQQLQENLQELNNELEERVESRTKAITESEARFRNMVEQSPVAMLVNRGENLIFETVNQPMIDLIGKGESVRGKPWFEAIPELKGQPVLERLYNTFHNGNEWIGNEVSIFLNRNGRLQQRFYNLTYKPLIESGQIAGVLQSAVDVTEQVKAKQALVESEAWLRAIFEQAPMGMALLKGKDLVIELANDNILKLWSKSRDVIGKITSVVRPEVEAQSYLKILQEVYATGVAYKVHEAHAYILHEGKKKWGYYNITYQPVKDNAGITTGILVMADDVTEKVLARKEQEKIYEQISLAKDASRLGMFDADLINNTIDWDDRCRQLYGITHNEPINYENDFLNSLHEEDKEKVLQGVAHAFNKALFNGEYEMENRLQRGPDKEVIWVRTKGKVFFDAQDKPVRFIGYIQDVTKQLIERKELERTEEMLKAAIESAQLGTWSIDIATSTFVTSVRFKQIFGFNADEELPYDVAIRQIAKEYRDQVDAAAGAAIMDGANFDVEYPLVSFRDNKLRWVKSTGRLYESEPGKPSHFSGTILDITERKMEEIRKNTFIAMVSHELKTPLTSLKAYVQILSMTAELEENNFVSDALNKVNSQVNKMTTMISSFLNVARLEAGKIELQKKEFDLPALVSERVEEMISGTQRSDIYIAHCPPLIVNADYEKIGQVLNNLLSNAIKFSPQGKPIEVTCSNAGNIVTVCVKDEGMGIKAQDITRVFERFYRVESQQIQTMPGFGIGLYLCAEIVRRHDGKIWVESEWGKGSAFYFSLPVV